MHRLLLAVAIVAVAVSARATGCLIFDATAPKALADGSVVYPLSDAFPKVVPANSCAGGSNILSPAQNFILVDVSPACHPIKLRDADFVVKRQLPERFAAMVKPRAARFTTAGLYTDGHGKCGPLAPASTKQAQWSSY